MVEEIENCESGYIVGRSFHQQRSLRTVLTIYGKGAKQDLTAEETAAWRRIVEEIENG